ncbi:aldose 1-epimerase [Stygiolobus caldivivus]|uniref:Aldose epimerase n=1 Tax=Stygiolobus caldivivus TaxID=2824673 RepID=A0A8D5U7P8_9CREN|nr:aldose 1-epimerase [Stygiolobus caldivivus]BCU70863.1 aldose epimerase [Stygiolobus caldivivus]
MEILNDSSRAIILEKGAYLYHLTLNGKPVLLEGKERQTRGGMALLIPYANRVKGGKYVWKGKEYSLPLNSEGNAIHGLVMDKVWDVKRVRENEVELSLVLNSEGYPTILQIVVEYKINSHSFLVNLGITNIGKSDAPLTVGFHPYFIVKGEWSLMPNKARKCISQDKIPTGEMQDDEIINKQYDDCFYLPEENITLSSSYSTIRIRKKNLDYIQLYTVQGAVAVEPMSGAPDAYHNGLGLKVISPNETVSYEVEFTLLR